MQTTPTLPTNLELEQSVLAAILYNNDRFHDIAHNLETAYFADEVHRKIFVTARAMITTGKAANAVTLVDYFKGTKQLKAVDQGYLAELQGVGHYSERNLDDYIETLRDLWIRREAMNEIQRANEDLVEHEAGALTLIEQLESRLQGIADRGLNGTAYKFLGESLPETMQRLEGIWEHPDELIGITSGLTDLDEVLGGLEPTNLLLLAARPAMGKTLFAGNIALAAAKTGANVLFESLEMSRFEIEGRFLSQISKVPYTDIRRGRLDMEQKLKVKEANEYLRTLPIVVQDESGATPERIYSTGRRMKNKGGLDLVVVDQLGHMKTNDEYQNETQRLGIITKGTKKLAKDLDVPALLLHQLSRGVEGREDKRPTLADLRDSGHIEQDADVVIFLYRAAYYKQLSEPRRKSGESDTAFFGRCNDWKKEVGDEQNVGEAIVAKNRGGPPKTVKFFCDLPTMRVENLSKGES